MIRLGTESWKIAICLVVLRSLVLVSPGYCQGNNRIPLWPLAAPLAKGSGPDDQPAIFLYLPPSHHPTPAAVVCPSGNYVSLSMDEDGRQVAEWLNNLGIAAFVLQYRLAPTYRYPAQLLDAQRAIRYIRSNAALYNVSINEIGIMGFSSGGQLAALAATRFDAVLALPSDSIDRLSARPDFVVLVHPMITCSEPFRDATGCANLMGSQPRLGTAAQVSAEKYLTPKTPPAFLFHPYDDSAVPVENSLAFFAALRKAGVPGELHVFEHAPHGLGLALDDPALPVWPKLLENWFRVRGLLPRKASP